MRFIASFIILCCLVLFSNIASGGKINRDDDIYYQFFERKMTILFDAISQVESNRCIHAYNSKENAVGVVQYRDIAINEINRNFGASFKHEQAYDPNWSYIFFMLTMSLYNQEADYERGSRVHNGGCNGWYVTETNSYWEKVDYVLNLEYFHQFIWKR